MFLGALCTYKSTWLNKSTMFLRIRQISFFPSVHPIANLFIFIVVMKLLWRKTSFNEDIFRFFVHFLTSALKRQIDLPYLPDYPNFSKTHPRKVVYYNRANHALKLEIPRYISIALSRPKIDKYFATCFAIWACDDVGPPRGRTFIDKRGFA